MSTTTSTLNSKTAVTFLQNYLLSLGAKLPRFGADGGKGQETYAAIDSLNPNEFPEFVKIALREVGTREIQGSKHNPRVLEYQKETMGKYTDDETPWCGAFVSWVFRRANIDHGIAIPERAKEWAKFGTETKNPVIGTVAVKSRIGGGHVCIVVGKLPNGNLLCVGGNQSDEVNIASYNPSVFENFRNWSGFGDSSKEEFCKCCNQKLPSSNSNYSPKLYVINTAAKTATNVSEA